MNSRLPFPHAIKAVRPRTTRYSPVGSREALTASLRRMTRWVPGCPHRFQSPAVSLALLDRPAPPNAPRFNKTTTSVPGSPPPTFGDGGPLQRGGGPVPALSAACWPAQEGRQLYRLLAGIPPRKPRGRPFDRGARSLTLWVVAGTAGLRVCLRIVLAKIDHLVNESGIVEHGTAENL